MAWSDVHEELFQKVNQEMDDYARSMWDIPGCAVYGKADEIAAMKFCYNQLVGHLDDYRAEDLEWLLGYQKPLEAVCSHWMMEQNLELDVEFDRIFRDGRYEDPESGMEASGMS